jgi:uncharacterized protein (TIGR02284 family)
MVTFHIERYSMHNSTNDISILNSLIATTLDSVEGYETSAADIQASSLAAMFTARGSERRAVVSQLQAEVSRLGGNPEDDGTVLAGAHRVFVNLKSVVTGQDTKAIVNEVERGEDHIKAKYEDALKDSELSAESRNVIQIAWQSVREGHDQMRDIKHSMEAQA